MNQDTETSPPQQSTVQQSTVRQKIKETVADNKSDDVLTILYNPCEELQAVDINLLPHHLRPPPGDLILEAKEGFVRYIASIPRIRASLWSAVHLRRDVAQTMTDAATSAKKYSNYGLVNSNYYKLLKVNICEVIYHKDMLKCRLAETDHNTNRPPEYYLSEAELLKAMDRYLVRAIPGFMDQYDYRNSEFLWRVARKILSSQVPDIARLISGAIDREVEKYNKHSREIIDTLNDLYMTSDKQLAKLDQILNKLGYEVLLYTDVCIELTPQNNRMNSTPHKAKVCANAKTYEETKPF